jgi:GT2 family glycosyltransferase
MTNISIVILNYNGQKYLDTFLPSVLAYSTGAEVVVADNGSTDDSLALLRNNYPTVRVIALPENHGFAEGYNLALKQVEAKYYVLLNSDVEVTPHWLDPIIQLMDVQPNIAACQPKLLDYNRRTHFEYAGPVGGYIDYLGYPFCRGRMFQSIEEDHHQYDTAQEVFWACGACLFVKADLFHEMGGFDGVFFAHMEEIDLCWRLKNAGYRIYACGESVVYHVGGGTLAYRNPHKTFLNFRNGLALLYKNHPKQDLYLNIFKRLLLDGIAGVKFLIDGSPADCWAIIKAHFSFYFSIGDWHKKRKHLLQTRKLVTHPEIYAESIVKAYFLQKKTLFTDLNWRR